MAHFVYILQSLKDFRYYIGETADVESRLSFHNTGLQRFIIQVYSVQQEAVFLLKSYIRKTILTEVQL